MRKITILLLFAVLMTVSCGKKDTFNEEFDTIMNNSTEETLLPELLELDKKYPDRLRTKVNIAALYIRNGENEKAEDILAESISLAEKSTDSGEKYLFYTNYAEYLFQKENFAESIKAAKTALENDNEDPYGVSLTMAQSLAAEKKYGEALDYFKSAWNRNINLFTEQDLSAFLSLLGISQQAEENIEIMVALFDEIRARNPSFQGSGFRQAELLEQAGASIASLIAVFSEIEYARYQGMMDNADAVKSLEMLYENITSVSEEDSGKSKAIIDGYKSFIKGEWGRAEAAFAAVEPEVPVAFYTYLRLASMLQTGQGNDQILSGYSLLERYYSGLQNYYYHFWNGIKKGNLEVEDEIYSNILKNCILISSDSELAAESRGELGRVHGIEKGSSIVLIDEVFSQINSVIQGASPDVLEKTAVMLEMDDNVFIDDAMDLLKEAFRNEAIASWFRERAQKGNEKIRERINTLL